MDIMPSADFFVCLVEDDEATRDALSFVLRSSGVPVRAYAAAEDLLAAYDPRPPHCVITDVRLPGVSGVELQDRLRIESPGVPFIIITGHGDVPIATRAFKAGAIDFIEKPVDAAALLAAVDRAYAISRDIVHERERVVGINRRLQTLTPREREVMDRIVRGATNKVVAAELGISPRTVEIYRRRVMEKMQARTLPDLVRMAEAASLAEPGIAAVG
jgi:FixJ family two-component response regulator